MAIANYFKLACYEARNPLLYDIICLNLLFILPKMQKKYRKRLFPKPNISFHSSYTTAILAVMIIAINDVFLSSVFRCSCWALNHDFNYCNSLRPCGRCGVPMVSAHLERAVWVRALVEIITLSSWARHSTLMLSLSIQILKLLACDWRRSRSIILVAKCYRTRHKFDSAVLTTWPDINFTLPSPSTFVDPKIT